MYDIIKVPCPTINKRSLVVTNFTTNKEIAISLIRHPFIDKSLEDFL